MEEPNGSASSHHEWLNHNVTAAIDTADSVRASSAHAPRKLDDNRPLVSPPYWHTRQRGNSSLSDVSQKRLSGPIRLKDNSEEESDQFRACWAKSARIDDYVIISGSMPKAGMGSYVVWNCTLETLNVGLACLLLTMSVSLKYEANACIGRIIQDTQTIL
jgi:hypothetical protein